MASENRTETDSLKDQARQRWESLLAKEINSLDFFQALRLMECAHPEQPRLGTAALPSEDPIRLGMEPSLAFPASQLAAFKAGRDNRPPRLLVNFFGLLGPNGPLPLHLTEYARDRMRNANDPTLARFLDLFHHRMLSLFYRAWAQGRPAVNHDRPHDDRFMLYMRAMLGLALPSLTNRDALPDNAKLYYAARLSSGSRNAEGLRAIVSDYFAVRTAVEEFVGAWAPLPDDCQWQLGKAPLGQETLAGRRIWSRIQKFRLVLGPMNQERFDSFLPGQQSLKILKTMVHNYVGDELAWDLRLILDRKVSRPLTLGAGSRLGWDSWLGHCPPGGTIRQDLILDPTSEAQ